MFFDFNKVAHIEKPAPLVSTDVIRIQAKKEIKKLEGSLLKQGFNKQDLRRSGSDIFGDMGALDSSLANFFAWSVLSFGLFGGSSEILNMLNSSVFACMEGVSLLSSEEFGRKQGQKSDMYPEGRCHFLIGTKEDMSGLCLISAKHMRRCGSRDKAKLTSAHKLLSMLDKLEEEGVHYVGLDYQQDIYMAVKARANREMSKDIFNKNRNLTVH